MKNIVVVGGGLIGLGTGYRMQEQHPDSTVTVLEKEEAVGRHQSGHNSGVLHSGLYYKPGSLKAKMAVRGIRQMIAFCEEHSIAHEVCGKLVVAVTAEEIPRLKDLESRGAQNGLKGLQWMRPSEYREIEPNAGGVAALRVPEEGIADYKRVAEALVRVIQSRGGAVVTSARAERFRKTSSGWVVSTAKGEYEASFVINCAGLHSDRVTELAGQRRDVRIVPFRGEYYKLKPGREGLVRHLIYPVPDPKFPFLGVHYTRMIGGGVECGPNAVLAYSREGYRKSDFRAGDLLDALTYPGLWRFLARYPRMCWDEIRRSYSKKLFCESLQQLVPCIQMDDLMEGGAGVRAQAMTPSGDLVQDFHFVTGPRMLHVVNAPSPGATCSLAIGEEIVARAEAFFG
ncbi:MAG: L-2-hydroxyglutarate oxidase [Candidatus Solibacter usitatus]|nr:L-2-hydroxyglutarate oxidase [Candidatus Solibacter usitatus]